MITLTEVGWKRWHALCRGGGQLRDVVVLFREPGGTTTALGEGRVAFGLQNEGESENVEPTGKRARENSSSLPHEKRFTEVTTSGRKGPLMRSILRTREGEGRLSNALERIQQPKRLEGITGHHSMSEKLKGGSE